MSEQKKKKSKPTYRHRTNAVHVTVYHPAGETIPVEVRKAIEDSVWKVAQENKLLINIALT